MKVDFELKKIDATDLNRIIALADLIWPTTYASILSNDQINYMMEMMYSVSALRQQMSDGVQFYLIQVNKKDIGFTAVEPYYKKTNQLYIHKIYLLPDLQGKGYGSRAIQALEALAKSIDLKSISLNVNRYNKALKFYERIGFEIIKEEDIDIGNGYWMNDYVMKKDISS